MRNRSDQPADVLDTIKESEENRRHLTQESSFIKDEAASKGRKQIEDSREEQQGNYENKGNKNYRKLFKPNVDGTVTTNNKESIYERNPYRTKEIVLKLEENQTMAVEEEDYTSFLNIPSRISKTRTVGNNNKENNVEESSYTSIQRTIKAQQNLPKAKRERDDHIFQNFEAESPINQYEPPYKKAYQVIQEYNPIDYTIPQSFNKLKEEVLELPQNNRSSKGFKTRPQSKRNTGTNHKSVNNNDERSLKDSKPDNFNIEGEKPNGVEPLVRCPEGCGRSFFESVVEKHARTCKQVFQNKRSAFDIVNHRMTEDQKKMAKLQPSKQNQITGKTIKPKNVIKVMPKWKQQSCAFRAIMKKAKGKQLTNDEQIAIVTNEQENFVQCEYCSRRFNEKAAERHIPFCQSKQKKEALKRYPKGKGIGMKK